MSPPHYDFRCVDRLVLDGAELQLPPIKDPTPTKRDDKICNLKTKFHPMMNYWI
jgi:hypothetical protein